MNNFDYTEFKKEFNCGDLCGLEYLEKTLIAEFKEKYKKQDYGTKEGYLISLFYAVKELNDCNNIYETCSSKIASNFKYDLYFETRDLLFKELGFNLEDIFE